MLHTPGSIQVSVTLLAEQGSRVVPLKLGPCQGGDRGLVAQQCVLALAAELVGSRRRILLQLRRHIAHLQRAEQQESVQRASSRSPWQRNCCAAETGSRGLCMA